MVFSIYVYFAHIYIYPDRAARQAENVQNAHIETGAEHAESQYTGAQRRKDPARGDGRSVHFDE
jgi:hypothetical protein